MNKDITRLAFEWADQSRSKVDTMKNSVAKTLWNQLKSERNAHAGIKSLVADLEQNLAHNRKVLQQLSLEIKELEEALQLTPNQDLTFDTNNNFVRTEKPGV